MFDASSPFQPDDSLRRMLDDDADQRLLALLDSVEDLVEEGRERDRGQGVDPGILALLDAVAGHRDAPYEFRSLHQRVHEGRLTWEQVWLYPGQEPGGADLLHAAMKIEGATLGDVLTRFEAEEPPPGSGTQVLR